MLTLLRTFTQSLSALGSAANRVDEADVLELNSGWKGWTSTGASRCCDSARDGTTTPAAAPRAAVLASVVNKN